MSWQGYLRHIVESLASEDEALLALLGGGDDDGGGGPNMKSLYTFESKMAMLTRLAATGAGAELLLESGLMHRYLKVGVSLTHSLTQQNGSTHLEAMGRQFDRL